ncbi:hypothetical protein R1sor_012457 [Riccia sorocarpa]|uniref:Endonuclease/exonuclease/phosphatase domain-containing protein n=1 Tax=Riccia sorocarpa TaxID=122646 RepID=A0ABD3I7Y4_9MARC
MLTSIRELKIATWNINDLGSLDKLKALQIWLRGVGRGVKVLALQELKARESNLEYRIKNILPGAKTIIDYSSIDRGGTALVIDPSIQIEERGVREDGSCAWAKGKIQEKSINFMSIYSPHEGREKQELYKWLKNFDLEGEWVILGDWNMVQRRIDTAGPTTLLQGFTQEKWRETDERWQLHDMFLMSSEQKGPLFTRQVVRGDRLDQSRLDRGYITRGGDWISAVKCAEHDGGEALSDHIPVEINIQLMRRRLNRRKGTYLKMDVDTLKNECRKNRVKSAWQSGWTLSQAPIIAWELAWGRVREEYKEFRREDKAKLSRLREMQAELGRARENISTTATQEEMLELAKLEREVKERETLEASIVRRRSRVNWIKEGEASRGSSRNSKLGQKQKADKFFHYSKTRLKRRTT